MSGENYALGIDVGGTATKVAIFDKEGNIFAQIRKKTVKDDINSLVVQIIGIAEEVLSEGEKKIQEVLGVGLSYPVLFDQPMEEMQKVSFNVPPMTKNELKRILANSFQKTFQADVRIFVENDHISPVLGEHWIGAARGAKNVVYLTLGTGISCGILTNGEPYYGLEGSSGSVGWMLLGDNYLDKKYPLGCFEYFCSGPGIVRRTIEEIHKGAKTEIFDLVDGKLENIACEMIFEAARKGDPLALKIAKDTSTYVGIEILNITAVLAPEIIVLGGGVGKSYDLLIERINEIIDTYLLIPSKKVRIVPSLLGDRASLVGAARLVFRDK